MRDVQRHTGSPGVAGVASMDFKCIGWAGEELAGIRNTQVIITENPKGAIL